jgi:hypothetical protein
MSEAGVPLVPEAAFMLVSEASAVGLGSCIAVGLGSRIAVGCLLVSEAAFLLVSEAAFPLVSEAAFPLVLEADFMSVNGQLRRSRHPLNGLSLTETCWKPNCELPRWDAMRLACITTHHQQHQLQLVSHVCMYVGSRIHVGLGWDVGSLISVGTRWSRKLHFCWLLVSEAAFLLVSDGMSGPLFPLVSRKQAAFVSVSRTDVKSLPFRWQPLVSELGSRVSVSVGYWSRHGVANNYLVAVAGGR